MWQLVFDHETMGRVPVNHFFDTYDEAFMWVGTFHVMEAENNPALASIFEFDFDPNAEHHIYSYDEQKDQDYIYLLRTGDGETSWSFAIQKITPKKKCLIL